MPRIALRTSLKPEAMMKREMSSGLGWWIFDEIQEDARPCISPSRPKSSDSVAALAERNILGQSTAPSATAEIRLSFCQVPPGPARLCHAQRSCTAQRRSPAHSAHTQTTGVRSGSLPASLARNLALAGSNIVTSSLCSCFRPKALLRREQVCPRLDSVGQMPTRPSTPLR